MCILSLDWLFCHNGGGYNIDLYALYLLTSVMLYCVSIVMFLMASLCVALSRLSCAYPYPNEHIRCFFWQLHCMYRCVHVYACQILPYSTVSNHDTIVHCTCV